MRSFLAVLAVLTLGQAWGQDGGPRDAGSPAPAPILGYVVSCANPTCPAGEDYSVLALSTPDGAYAVCVCKPRGR